MIPNLSTANLQEICMVISTTPMTSIIHKTSLKFCLHIKRLESTGLVISGTFLPGRLSCTYYHVRCMFCVVWVNSFLSLIFFLGYRTVWMFYD